PRAPVGVCLNDSSCLDKIQITRPFRWVVTSPPYFGMRSYWSDQWLRNWFLGGPADVTYSQKRQVSHRGVEGFTVGLAQVWAAVAGKCMPGARLIVRFGTLPCLNQDPR